MSVSDEEYAAINMLRGNGWTVVKIDGPPQRVTSIAAPAKGNIALISGSQILALLSPFDAEQLGRDLVDLADSTIAHPDYPT